LKTVEETVIPGDGQRERRVMRTGHGEVSAALGAWALDALPGEEALAVEAHLEVCTACAAEAERLRRATAWLGTSEPVPAAEALRSAVLAAARARRPPASIPRPEAAVGPYAVAVVSLEELLRDLTAAQWRLRVLRDWSVGDLLGHLTGNDARLADQLAPVGAGAAAGDSVRPRRDARRDADEEALAAWRGQADSILRRATAGGTDGLDRPIRLDGPDPSPHPVRHALVQRMFETWIHADDVRVALGRPTEPPPPAHAAAIAALGIRLLPAALRQAGVAHPGRSARLILTNPDGDWTIPLGPMAHGATAEPGPAGAQAPRTADVTIITDTVEFGRLMAGRRTATTLAGTVDGDRRLAAELLGVIATLGCGH
jgi:uncharacterized protein (TIGR03083 family)